MITASVLLVASHHHGPPCSKTGGASWHTAAAMITIT
jgi:hypothetical protein